MKVVWTYILVTWKLQNTHLHQNTGKMDLPNYQQAAILLYKLRNQLPPDAQAALYTWLLRMILKLPAPKLQTWIQQGHDYLN